MKTKISIKQSPKKKKFSVTLYFTRCSRVQFKDEFKNEDKINAHRKNILIQLGEKQENIIPLVIAAKPVLIVLITESMILERCDFLQLTYKQRRAMVEFCNDVPRKDMCNKFFVGKDCTDSHFKNVRYFIGDYSDKDLKELLLCDKVLYLSKYYEQIEAFKLSNAPNYLKRLLN